jgi:hypothetical protein
MSPGSVCSMRHNWSPLTHPFRAIQVPCLRAPLQDASHLVTAYASIQGYSGAKCPRSVTECGTLVAAAYVSARGGDYPNPCRWNLSRVHKCGYTAHFLASTLPRVDFPLSMHVDTFYQSSLHSLLEVGTTRLLLRSISNHAPPSSSIEGAAAHRSKRCIGW